MATKRWIGGAVAVAQVQSYLFGGTWEADDIVRITIGQKVVDFEAGDTDIETVIDDLVTAFNALDETDYPEFAEMTASKSSTDTFVLTCDTAGYPFIVTLTPLEANGDPADDQEIEAGGVATTGTEETACAGPNHWDTARNWDANAVPVTGDDVYFCNSTVDCLYGFAQSAVTLASLQIEQSFTGDLGLADHTGLYPEYRATYLAVSATTLRVGYGPGTGSGLLRINVGTAACTLHCLDTGSSTETGVETLLWKGTHASNVVNIYRGSLGIAVKPGETATVLTLRVGYETNVNGDAIVRCGSGVTLTTIEQSGGEVEISSNATTVTKSDGTLLVNNTATITTYNIDGGKVYHRSSGTITTAKVGDGGELNLAQDMRARTITNTTLTKGASLKDPFRTVTFTNPLLLERCGLADVDLDLGLHITIQRANGA